MLFQKSRRTCALRLSTRGTSRTSFWSTLANSARTAEAELSSISLHELQLIVQSFIHDHAKVQQPAQPTAQTPPAEDEFDDFQGAESDTYGNYQQPIPQPTAPTKEVVYADFDWNFLMVGGAKKQEPNIQPKHNKLKLEAATLPAQAKPKAVPTVQLLDIHEETWPKNTPMVLPPLPLSPPKPEEPLPKAELPKQVVEVNNRQMYDEIARSEAESSKVRCLKLQQNNLELHSNITFRVVDIKLEEKDKTYLNKLFKASELVYTIKTEGRNKFNAVGIAWTVRRKYSDFEWLKNILAKIFPGLVIPPLPAEPTADSKLSLVSASNKLQFFLQEVFLQKELRNSRYFEGFLSLENSTDFDVYRKSTENLAKPKGVSSVVNSTGEVKINFNKAFHNYGTLITDYVAKNTLIYKKIKETSKEINLLYESLALKFHELSEAVIELKDATAMISIGGGSQIPSVQKLSSTYELLSGVISDHSAMIIKDKERFQNYFSDYFAYERLKVENIVGLVNRRNEFAAAYDKKSASPHMGVFSKLSTAVFGEKEDYLDVPSAHFETLKQQFGYYNHQLFSETVRFFENEISSHAEHFTSYGNQRIGVVDEQQSYWSHLMVSLSKLQAESYFLRQSG